MLLSTDQNQTKVSQETIAVVIPTLNVEAIIRPCLDQLTWADEVVIVDMFSTDRTKEICCSYPNVRFLERKDYIFANVNYGMEQANTDWVIRLDSDEILDQTLQASIQEILKNPNLNISGYYFPSTQYMFGLPMAHGVGKPDACLRKCMFRKGTAHYECNTEHEDIVTTGNLGVLSGHYEHLTNHTVEEVVRKFNYYTTKDIERLPNSEPEKPRRTLYKAFRMFILYYFQWKGYQDGWLGFYTSLFRGPVYIFIEDAKRWEKWRAQKGEASSLDRYQNTQNT
jgi:glycosyltransferase involved in cell wall biosynthesis